MPSPWQLALGVLLVLVIQGVLYFCFKLYQTRAMFRGLPKPPHHWLLGNLVAMHRITSRLPPDCHGHSFNYYLRKEYNLPNLFYLDLWPFADPMCVVVDPELAVQVTQQPSLPKHHTLGDFLTPLLGADNIISADGESWKHLRAMFNPAFSLNHLMTLVPSIVDHTLTFVETLNGHAARGETFPMLDEAVRLTVDIIGTIVLDVDLNAQRSENELVNAFKSQCASLPNLQDALWRIDPRKWPLQRRNTRVMNAYLGRVLRERFASCAAGGPRRQGASRRHAIDLALDAYGESGTAAGASSSSSSSSSSSLDPAFVARAVSQFKAFLFAGHDTTSSTIAYAYHLLALNPACLARLRAEHAAVFGGGRGHEDGEDGKDGEDGDAAAAATTMTATTAAAIKARPAALLADARLPYTTAVIKETLRLYPPVSTVRAGAAGAPIVVVNDDDGGGGDNTTTSYPTAGFLVWVPHHTMHRRADLFPRPLEFRPERFLPGGSSGGGGGSSSSTVDGGDGAWRPFERGPRNCVARELALLETKVILALTARLFDVSPAYAGPGRDRTPWGSAVRLGCPGAGAAAASEPTPTSTSTPEEDEDEEEARARVPLNMVDGERAYQVLQGTAKPKDGYPCRVRKRGAVVSSS